jgi:hypothetical protein
MLYASEDPETALRETVDRPSLHTVAEFTTERDATIIDFARLPRIPSLFEPIPDSMEYEPRKLLIFLHTLGREFSKPIIRDDRVHIEYVPTQVVTEYLRGMKTRGDTSIDGIRYGSARHEGGASLVLFCDPNNLVLPKEQQKEFYDLHRDRWIKLVDYQDRDISADYIAGWNAAQPARQYSDPFTANDDLFSQ